MLLSVGGGDQFPVLVGVDGAVVVTGLAVGPWPCLPRAGAGLLVVEVFTEGDVQLGGEGLGELECLGLVDDDLLERG